MADFNDMLSRVISDPAAMAQITALAQSLGMQGPPPSVQAPAQQVSAPQSPPHPQPAPPRQAPGSGQMYPQDAAKLMSSLLQISQKMGTDERQVALFKALRPFLRPERAQRLDLAIQVAKLSRLAGNTLQGMGMSQQKGW